MKTLKTSAILILFSFLGLAIPLQSTASPVFPQNDNDPLKAVAESPNQPNDPKPTTTTDAANLNKGVAYSLAQINIEVLFGVNQHGEKSYKTTYVLAETVGEKGAAQVDPKINVTFKKKSDIGKFGVDEVSVKKINSNSYKISAKVVPLKTGETITPKITFLN